MFCSNCGTKLPFDANFCANCGKRVSNQLEGNDSNSAKEFCICQRSLQYGSDYLLVNELFSEFSSFSWNKYTDFQHFYKNEVKTIDDVFGKAIPLLLEGMHESIQLGIDVLMQHGIDTYDYPTLAEIVLENNNPATIVEPIAIAVENIQNQEAHLNAYRAVKNAGRSRWSGGGFGVAGAIKGALTAGAFNLATDTLRGIGDTLTTIRDISKIERLNRELVNDPFTINLLAQGVKTHCFCVCNYVWEILVNHGIIPWIDLDTKTEDSRLNNYIQIYNQDSSVKSKIVQILLDAIEKNPFRVSYYAQLFDFSGSKKAPILEMATFFGLEDECKAELDAILYKRVKRIKSLPSNTADDLGLKLQLVDLVEEDNPPFSLNDYKKTLQEKLEKFLEIDSIKQIANKIANDISDQRKHIDTAIKNSDYEFLFAEIEKGNIYAEYTLEKHFCLPCKQEKEQKKLYDYLSKILDYKKAGQDYRNKYIQYLFDYGEYLFYKDGTHIDWIKETVDEAVNKMIEAASQGVISAIARIGILGTLGQISAKKCGNSKAIKLLELLTQVNYPSALSQIGYYHSYAGSDLCLDRKKAKYFLFVADAYGDTWHKKTLIELENIVVDFSIYEFEVSPDCSDRDTVKKKVSEILGIPIAKNKDYPSTESASERKIMLRRRGDYETYFSEFEDTVDVDSEIEESIDKGTVCNYFELGMYIDKRIKNLSSKSLSALSSQQSREHKNNNYMANAIKSYMTGAGFSGHEFILLIYAANPKCTEGFTISSRGLYVAKSGFLSKTCNFVSWKDFETTAINITENELAFGQYKTRISSIDTIDQESIKQLLEDIFVLLPEVNQQFLLITKEDHASKALTDQTFIEKLKAIQ